VNYRVTCTIAADGELAAIWITAKDRTAVSEAAAQIEQGLKVAPLDHGESREGSQRIMFVAPLGVRYVVYPADCRVIIVQFWTY
jgi:tRNA(Met) C34 N-acetyltransferase TmcA